ncbi:WD40 repeat [Kalmanozyma brasiliensis GHG001]|uniref:Putative TUP1-general transcription repressor n=1 Tax=Kalmanozyma brasiliensis (strain GHG001) TaxID=1365824 RepID=V5EPW2_KALBG|nr:WD40 repeat [Kalmanozyma brasiliensis GHG001]EST04978.1 WD40 repeat [Kalmanozyma brasiliensis GHG001]
MYNHRSIVPSAGAQGPPSGPPPPGPGGAGPSQAAAAAAAAAQQGPHPGGPVAGGPGGPAPAGPPGAAAGPPGAAPPAGAPHTSSARLADLLDFVRHEFDLLGNDTANFKAQRDDLEHRVTSHISEVNMMQNHFYELEKRHTQIIQQYEEEVKRLRSILDSRGLSSEHGAPPASSGPMSGPPHLPASGACGPLPIASAGGPPPPGGPGGAGSAMFNGNGSEYPRGNGFDRDREPLRNPTPSGGKDAKRMRVDYSGPPSPGADRDWIKKEERPSREEDKWDRPSGGAAPLGPGPAQSPHGAPPLPPANYRDTADSPTAAAAAAGNVTLASLSDMDPDEIPKDLKKEGADWLAIFNPKIKRTLDVNLVHTFLHESVVCCVRFSADGKYLATGCNKSAQIFDTKTGAKTCVLTDASAGSKGDLYIRSVCFSPDGKCLATGAEDRQIRIWDIGKKKVRHLFAGHKQEIYSLDYSKDGRIIASGSGDKTVRIWDVENGQLLHTLYTSPGLEHGPSEAGVTSVSISSDNRLVAAGALDTLVRVWDAQTGKQLERLKSHKDSIYSVSFAPDGKSLVSGSLDKTLKLWDLTGTAKAVSENRADEKGNASCATTFVGHKDYVLSVSCSPDGQWVASGSKDRGVQFWDPKTAQAQFVLQGHKNSVIAINLSPAGGLLATGSGDFNARIWSYDRIQN